MSACKNVPAYSVMASVYEEMMAGVDFEKWARYLARLLERYNSSTADADCKKILDLGCGTAVTSLFLARRGWSLTGLDSSPQMIEQAGRNAQRDGLSAEFTVGDIRDFRLGKTFEACLCLHDTINHLLAPEEVEACFRSVADHLRPGGLFLFDLTTEASLIDHFHGRVFEDEAGGYFYHWENHYDRASKQTRVRVTFSSLKDSSETVIEEHLERVYEIDEMKRFLYNAGLEFVEVFELFTEFPPHAKSYGLCFAARRGR